MLLALSLQHPQWLEISHRIIAIFAFLVATGAGFHIVRLGTLRSPWVLFLAQAVLVGAVSLPFVRGSQSHDLLLVSGLCLALGLQNGVVTSAGGVSLHATFLSGNVTSLIKLFSQDPAGDNTHSAKQKASKSAESKGALLFSVAVSFVGGAYCASLLIGRLGFLSPLVLLLPLAAAAVLSSIPPIASQATKNELLP